MLSGIIQAIAERPTSAFCAAVELFLGIRDILGKKRLFLMGKYDDPAYRAMWQRRDGINELMMGILFASYLLPDKYDTVKLVIDIVCLAALVINLVLSIAAGRNGK